MDYSPELDPEIHGFLREQRSHNRGPTQESRGSMSTFCELRIILDGLEKLGFQLVTTSSYTFQGRSHNEFIVHREMNPAELNTSMLEKPDLKKSQSSSQNKQKQSQSSNSSNQSRDKRENVGKHWSYSGSGSHSQPYGY